MIEIFAIYTMNKRIGNLLRAKGRKPLGYQLLAILLWFGAEITGYVAGAVVLGFLGLEQPDRCLLYVFGVLGALTGGVVAYVIADSVKPATGAVG